MKNKQGKLFGKTYTRKQIAVFAPAFLLFLLMNRVDGGGFGLAVVSFVALFFHAQHPIE